MGFNRRAKLPVYDTVNKVIKKFHTHDQRIEFLDKNPNFIQGSGPHKTKRQMSCKAYNKITLEKKKFPNKHERDEFLKLNADFQKRNPVKKIKSSC